MTTEEKKSWAIAALCQKAQELRRIPKKEDFDEAARSRIKAFLGPWPRALEAAGLKAPRPDSVKSRKKSKSGSRSFQRCCVPSAEAVRAVEGEPV